MQPRAILEQLSQRRVIRAAAVHVAVSWVAVQVADVLASNGIVPGSWVTVLIILAIVGFPVTIVASWFLESPWQHRKASAVAGDVAIIAAIVSAAIVIGIRILVPPRPVVAVTAIEATDLREATAVLADDLARQIRTLLASRIEFKVLESSSSLHPALADRSLAEKAGLLGAEYVVTGTLSQGESLRLNLQVFDDDGDLVGSETIEDSPEDLATVRRNAVAAAAGLLGLDETSIDELEELALTCTDPAGFDHIANARRQFRELPKLPKPEQPVAQSLAMQSLADAEAVCAGYPEIELLRLQHTRTFRNEGLEAAKYFERHASASSLYYEYRKAYIEIADMDTAEELVAEAVLLDPAAPALLCEYRRLLESDSAEAQRIDRRIEIFVPDGCNAPR
ncbi:MAG: hypothetical protein R3358_04685 [Woeseiaceae bacterium]|nr:hypothetical protein [Woeseiaceae bacterium]